MKVLLTGVEYDKKGMIGSALKQYLEDRDVTVIPFEDDVRSKPNWSFYDTTQVDMVIHLAALAGVRQSVSEPDHYWDVNVNGTRRALEFATKHNIKILYASSSNAYEWWTNPYAATKKACETLAEIYDCESIGMRFHTVWPGRDDMLFKKIERDEVDYINAFHSRDFIHIDDLCHAIWLLMENFHDVRDNNKVVDIGTGKSYNVFEVYNKWSGGRDIELKYDSTPLERCKTKADNHWLIKLGWETTKEIL